MTALQICPDPRGSMGGISRPFFGNFLRDFVRIECSPPVSNRSSAPLQSSLVGSKHSIDNREIKSSKNLGSACRRRVMPLAVAKDPPG